MEYTVTEFRADLEPRVVALHKTLIRTEWRLSRSYLRWKYQDNPFLPEPMIQLVRLGEEVVGMRGLFGTAWRFGAGRATTVLPHADDLIIHPDHRNRGLFLRLNESALEAARSRGFSAVLSLSGGPVTQRLQRAAGWTCLGDLERWYRDGSHHGTRWRIRGRNRVERTARHFGFSPGAVPSNGTVDRRLHAIAQAGGHPVSGSVEADLRAMAELAESSSPADARSCRTVEFLRWRLSNPHRRYRFLYWRDSGLRGYMILAWKGRDPLRITVADYAASDTEVLGEMLDVLVAAEPHEYRVLASSLPPLHRSAFRRAGFAADPSFSREQRGRFLFFPFVSSEAPATRALEAVPYPDGWRLGLLDTMSA
jgi:GNAT superfamily N-acetyltransferase